MAKGDIHNLTGTICKAEFRCPMEGGHSKDVDEYLEHHFKDSEENKTSVRTMLKDGTPLADAVQIAKQGLSVSGDSVKRSSLGEAPDATNQDTDALREAEHLAILGPKWRIPRGLRYRGDVSYESDAGRISFDEDSGWTGSTVDGRNLGQFGSLEEAAKHVSKPKPLVKLNSKGEPVWGYQAEKMQYLAKELKKRGYTFNMPEEEMAKPFYLSRSGSVVSNQIQQTFATKAAASRYEKEWYSYSRPYDSIEIVSRDSLVRSAAFDLLADAK